MSCERSNLEAIILKTACDIINSIIPLPDCYAQIHDELSARALPCNFQASQYGS